MRIFQKITLVFQGRRGELSLYVLVFAAVSMIMLTGFVGWAYTSVDSVLRYTDRVSALEIAESGIEYYRWHLAHAPTDYEDGTGLPGPYVHPYYDRNGNRVGTFTLEITPPPSGSAIVYIKSTGELTSDPSIKKVIEARLGIPSFAKYAAVLDADVRFGEGTEVFGPIHSNKGIRFDGVANNLVTSALGKYDDPDHSGANEYAVHTHISPVDPYPTATLPAHTDVFKVGRLINVPPVDFIGITQTLSAIASSSQAGGFYRASSSAFGYEVVFNVADRFDLYKVTALTAPPRNCSNSTDGWGTWSISSSTLMGNYALPANGLMFFADDVWVRGKIDGARITLAAARFPDNPSTRASITVNADLLYTRYDGTDIIGLIAQKNFNVGLKSADTIRIDAALIAQNGRAGRYYYVSQCGGEYKRSTITLYGMIGSSQRYGFAYTDGTGYQTRNIIYDGNLLYSPPPSFPLTTDPYQIIYWNEAK